jgi:Cu(I)/Ag(I) efflux system protein CusF
MNTKLIRPILTALLSMGVTLSALAQAVEGEIKKIDADTGKITLKHGEIKNLDMPAMQMSFRVSDPAWLKRFQVGDKVTFTADKVGGQFTLVTLEPRK